MNIKRMEFLAAMKRSLPGVETGTSLIEGADTLVFSNQGIHSYNDNISVSVPFKFPAVEEKSGILGAVKATDFFKLISKMSGDEITMESNDKIFTIKAGPTEVEMNKITNNISEYIRGLDLDHLKWKPIPSDFFQGLRLCKIDRNRTPHRGIFVMEKTMFSTDISRINSFRLSREMDRFLIDDPSVGEILKMDKLKDYAVTEAWVHFNTEDGSVFSCKKKDDEPYPIQKIQSILDAYRKTADDLENTLPKAISEIADRVNTLSGEIDGRQAIRMDISQSGISFFAERYTGKIKEDLKLDKKFTKPIDLSIWVDPSFLIEASKKAMNFYVRAGKERTILAFYHEDVFLQIASTFQK